MSQPTQRVRRVPSVPPQPAQLRHPGPPQLQRCSVPPPLLPTCTPPGPGWGGPTASVLTSGVGGRERRGLSSSLQPGLAAPPAPSSSSLLQDPPSGPHQGRGTLGAACKPWPLTVGPTLNSPHTTQDLMLRGASEEESEPFPESQGTSLQRSESSLVKILNTHG